MMITSQISPLIKDIPVSSQKMNMISLTIILIQWKSNIVNRNNNTIIESIASNKSKALNLQKEVLIIMLL
jgi:hypothetical protein